MKATDWIWFAVLGVFAALDVVVQVIRKRKGGK
jgi:hypothetical protein